MVQMVLLWHAPKRRQPTFKRWASNPVVMPVASCPDQCWGGISALRAPYNVMAIPLFFQLSKATKKAKTDRRLSGSWLPGKTNAGKRLSCVKVP